MADKTKSETTATEGKPAKAKRPRKARTFILIRNEAGGGGTVVSKANTLKLLRTYGPTPEDGDCTYQEAVLVGGPFSLKPVTSIVRESVK